MKPFTLFITLALVAFVVFSVLPNSEAQSRGRKMKIMKKLGAILLLQRKKYLFAVPFPLPIPIPLLKKTQPIIYKEKVAVPVPVSEPVPVPVHEPAYETPNYENAASYEEPANIPY